ncbi:MAG: outer membrane lipid asymmetry maintenance protein MlaD [Gammaproteobacteria bacterium]|nr:outer membrane lipid asymmetry maintenance protein MlaD [Gammaproteobacteria bacterium]
MINGKMVEIMVGLFVAAGIAALFMLAMKVSNLNAFSVKDGYHLKAHFDNIGGLKVQSPVSASGVRIGRVMAIEYDQDSYEAEVSMVIDPRYDRLPTDTTAGIYTSGLLGEQYISLEPGGSDTYLKDGDRLSLTQSALVLERIIGQFLFSQAADGAGKP